MRFFFSALLVLMCSTLGSSQQTGSFTLNIEFNETDYMFNRNLYFNVPDDYSSEEDYPLVIGFRGGPNTNAGQFRDQLSFLSDSLDAIILCLENSEHFWNNEGLTKQLFSYSLDTTQVLYSIDPEKIYLTGLSYGGRHATIVSMDTDDGEIPVLRGIIPFAAGSESDLQPNYESVDQFAPACICIGLDDSSNFINVSNNLHNDIQEAGGSSFLNEIIGVGHTVDFPSFPEEMMECFDFIDSQYEINLVSTAEPGFEILIYPNPSAGLFSIKGLAINEEHFILISDLGGNLIMSDLVVDSLVDLKHLEKGMYLLELKSETSCFRSRIVLE